MSHRINSKGMLLLPSYDNDIMNIASSETPASVREAWLVAGVCLAGIYTKESPASYSRVALALRVSANSRVLEVRARSRLDDRH